MQTSSEQGFIRIEVMMVIAIIAIPVTVAIPQYFRSIKIVNAPSVIGNSRITADVAAHTYAYAYAANNGQNTHPGLSVNMKSTNASDIGVIPLRTVYMVE